MTHVKSGLNFIEMEEWEFDFLIKSHCAFMECIYITGNPDDSRKSALPWTVAKLYAFVYKGNDGSKMVVNYFLRYENRVYQSTDIRQMLSQIPLIASEAKKELRVVAN